MKEIRKSSALLLIALVAFIGGFIVGGNAAMNSNANDCRRLDGFHADGTTFECKVKP